MTSDATMAESESEMVIVAEELPNPGKTVQSGWYEFPAILPSYSLEQAAFTAWAERTWKW